MNLRRSRRRITTSAMVVAAATALFSVPSIAVAAPPDPSDVVVSPTTVAQGDTFDVAVELHNPQPFTITFAKAALYTLETPLVDIVDLVSCTGATAECAQYLTSFRGPVGDLAPGQTRTVTFTFRVKDTADPGQFTLQHQNLGDNYAFDVRNGPVITVTGQAQAADLAVTLDASPRGVLTSRVTYVVTVTNNGPADATGIRVTANYAAGLSWGGSSDCVRVAGTRTVHCDLAALGSGDTATARFSTDTGLLAIGSFTTTAARTQSTPADPAPGNDTASRSCSALTGLLVSC